MGPKPNNREFYYFNEEWNEYDDELDSQEHLEDGVDDFTIIRKEKPYNDDDYDY